MTRHIEFFYRLFRSKFRCTLSEEWSQGSSRLESRNIAIPGADAAGEIDAEEASSGSATRHRPVKDALR